MTSSLFFPALTTRFVPPALSHHIPSRHVPYSPPSAFLDTITRTSLHFPRSASFIYASLTVLSLHFHFPELYPNPSFHSLSSAPSALPRCSWLDYCYYSHKWIPVQSIQRFKRIFEAEFLKLLLSMGGWKWSHTAGRWIFFLLLLGLACRLLSIWQMLTAFLTLNPSALPLSLPLSFVSCHLSLSYFWTQLFCLSLCPPSRPSLSLSVSLPTCPTAPCPPSASSSRGPSHPPSSKSLPLQC